MNILYLDCSAGIAGDMTVAALIDLGAPLQMVSDGLKTLSLPPASFAIGTERTSRGGIAATRFDVSFHEHHHHRYYPDIVALIDASNLAAPVKERSQRIFRRLAEAEALVHGVPLEQVHFHEVGAIDSIVDIVGTAICLDALDVVELYASALPYGRGWVETAHGRLPIPAPATAELMRGLQVADDPLPGEWVTPTGAAIVASLATATGKAPAMRITAVGHGAGSRDCPERPNLLRAVLGEATTTDDEIMVVETHLDDMNPEVLGFVMERLFAEGALDVAFSPLQMKKNRPGTKLTVITPRKGLDRLGRLILTETTAIGLRYYPVERMTLARANEERATSLGTVRVKVITGLDGSNRIAPEFDECRRLAAEAGLPLQEVYRIIERETAGSPKS
ncbi:MAG: nickel pincer cofactor biosynthesis protein LarC [Geobacter sp.]|nr:nickel pincer cofactor biosynthesis protein LarC [Geobacter sp.]